MAARNNVVLEVFDTDRDWVTATLIPQIQAEVGIRPPFALEAFADLDEDVRQSIARVKASPFVPHREEVRGFVYDVKTGRLREVV